MTEQKNVLTLYHFTSAAHLYGIGAHGLTVGDVPTDITRGKGKIGVWLTSDPTAAGHGLGGSRQQKTRFRLSVCISDISPNLKKWTDWAPQNATPETLTRLHATAPKFNSWYVYFGVIPPDAISACVDMNTGTPVADWTRAFPKDPAVPGVPAWRRQAWQKKMLKQLDSVATR